MEPYVESIQLDIMDGIFAPEKSWNEPLELKNIKTNLEIEAHLMVEDAESEVERWLDAGVKRILVHWEAILGKRELGIRNWEIILKKCEENNIELGLALNLETSPDVLSQFPVPSSQFPVQLMSIAKIGYHGQPFDQRVIHKIRALREMFSDVKISVDGGININNARQVVEAGADVLVVGSAIFNNKNISEKIKELKNRIKN